MLMTNRTWTASSGSFLDAANWSPAGSPQSGDVLTLNSGIADASFDTLSGYTIYLAGSGDTPGPGLTAVDNQPFQDAPDPTLILSQGGIGPGTSVIVPASPLYLPFPYGFGTLLINGSATNDGTITAAGGWFSAGGDLDISSYQSFASGTGITSTGFFQNAGDITAELNATINFFAYIEVGQSPSEIVPGAVENNGTVNVYGSVTTTNDSWIGTGTVNLDYTPGVLGLPGTPGQFVYDRVDPAMEMSSGLNFAFHGGELILDGSGFVGAPQPGGQADFDALLTNFGHDSTDLIQISDFTVNSTAFSNGVLDLYSTSHGPFYTSLRFGNLPIIGHLDISQNGPNTDITWAYYKDL
jgi:hypothetical protein